MKEKSVESRDRTEGMEGKSILSRGGLERLCWGGPLSHCEGSLGLVVRIYAKLLREMSEEAAKASQ